jgi:hypothetical protein
MLRLAADENFDNNIVRGLLRRRADLDIVPLSGCLTSYCHVATMA